MINKTLNAFFSKLHFSNRAVTQLREIFIDSFEILIAALKLYFLQNYVRISRFIETFLQTIFYVIFH